MKAVGILALAFVMSGCAVGASIISDMLESVGIETVGTRFDGTYCDPADTVGTKQRLEMTMMVLQSKRFVSVGNWVPRYPGGESLANDAKILMSDQDIDGGTLCERNRSLEKWIYTHDKMSGKLE